MKHVNQLGFVVLLLVLMITVPVAAANVTSMNATVSMAVGGGNAPTVMAKWETEPAAPSLESGDPLHAVPGSQFLPRGEFNQNKSLNYYAVITDPENNGNVLMAYADVWHPDGTFKYQIHFTQLSKADGIAAFNAASPKGLIKYGPGTANATILTELGKETAAVWMGTAEIHYCQMDGNYPVNVRAVDQNQNPSAFLNNTFYYTPVTVAEYDFTSVDYGSVSMGAALPVWRAGDTLFVSGDGKPTVRNVGNTKLKIKINQDDMGFGKDVNGVWNVKFDARLGHTSAEPLYDPFTDHILVDVLDRSHTDELDFSIHVLKGFGNHAGSITLSTLNPDTPALPNNP